MCVSGEDGVHHQAARPQQPRTAEGHLPRAAPRSRCTQAFGCICDGRTTYVKAHALENAAPRGIRFKFTNASSPRIPLQNTRRVKQLALGSGPSFQPLRDILDNGKSTVEGPFHPSFVPRQPCPHY